MQHLAFIPPRFERALQRQIDMPLILEEPDARALRTFRQTVLYKEIKALCALPATGKCPNDRWSLTRSLMKRESGIVASPSGSFTANQHRRIANWFLPNEKQRSLMSLDSKSSISKFNKDGSILITASRNGSVNIFDSSKDTYERTNSINITHYPLDVDFSPCGKFFVYASWYPYIVVASVNNKTEEFQQMNLNFQEIRHVILSTRFSPCGRKLIGGCNDSRIFIWDRETARVLATTSRRVSFDNVNAVSYASDKDSNIIISGYNNSVLKLWDTRDLSNISGGNCVGTFIGHFDGITYIDPRNDGNYFLSNSKDQSIKIWDMRRMTPTSEVEKRVQIPLYYWDYNIHEVPRNYYNPKTTLDGDVSVMTYRGHRVVKSLLRAKWSPASQTGQRYIYTGCSTGRIIIYDVLTGRVKEAIKSHNDLVSDLDWHPVRPEIVSSSWDNHINLNTYKRNPLLKFPNADRIRGPLRRSRRIAQRNGTLDDMEEDDERSLQW